MRCPDLLRSLLGNLVRLRVHHVTLERVAVDGLKCAEAHVQRQFAYFHTPSANRCKDLRCKMQSGGGSSNGSWPAGEDRLVSFTIRGFVVAVDVRRKRHVAQPLNLGRYAARVAGSESHRAQAELAAPDNLRFHLTCAKHDALARFHLAPG